MKTAIQHIDILNIFLIFMALTLAYLLPFTLFITAYAILGPLHYLTEINWLHQKGYYLKNSKVIIIPLIFAFLVFLPKFMHLGFMTSVLEVEPMGWVISLIDEYNNSFIFLWLMMSILSIFTTDMKYWIIVTLILIAIAIPLNQINLYQMIIGLFVPTLLHVYFFTGLFMLYGALKADSKLGMISVILLASVPIFICIVDFIPNGIPLSDYVKSAFVEGKFYATNTKLLGLFGIGTGTEFSFESLIDIKFQIFIAFAYTYHYLNWFSKTSVIQWHKNIDLKKSMIILALWVGSILIFWYDYHLGIVCLLGLSVLHVFLEFPLNIISIKEIPRLIMDRLR